MKKILIFYSKTGGGHLRAAEALAEEISLRKSYQVALYDGLEKTYFDRKTKIDFLFFLTSHYGLFIYNFFYRLTDTKFGLLILRWFIKLIWGGYFRKIIEEEKPDLIITTHHFISPSTIGTTGRNVPFVIVVTDLGKPHRIWFDDKAASIIVPHQDMTYWAKEKFSVPDLKIKSLGYPLKRGFRKVKQTHLSNQLIFIGTGIKPNLLKNWIRQVRSILPDKKIIIICGQNRTLQKSLHEYEGKEIQIYGFIDNLHLFLEQSDIVISKAGPGIIMESSALKRPIIIVAVSGIQEKGNVDFVVSNNLGIYDPQGKNLVSSILKVYKDYKKYTSSSYIFYDTGRIVDFILKF